MVRAAIVVLTLFATALPASAEVAWVKDELRLNLRTGPGTQYRIKASVGTGDKLDVLEHGDGWTRVRGSEVGEGWIPEGFLQSEPPAGTRLAESEAQAQEFRTKLDSATSHASELETQNAELSKRDTSQKQRIEALERENFELRAGARWPEWITGAGILALGMAAGAILQAVGGRRQRPRIRL